MKGKIKKIFNLFLAVFMVFSMVKVTAHAATSESTINYNVPSSTVPFIYCYSTNGAMTTLKNGDKQIPDNASYFYMYFTTSKLAMNKADTKVSVNGVEVTGLYWDTANNGYYTRLKFYIPIDVSAPYNVNVEIDYQLERNFDVRARKIFNSQNNDLQKMEDSIKTDPTQYALYNEDQSLVFKGEIDTAINSYTNFVHWQLVTGNGNYFPVDDTRIKNLPNGNYTIAEVKGTEGLTTLDSKGSSSVWLDSSISPKTDSQGAIYYTFTVSDETVQEWMKACANEGQANSLFYGFYTDQIKQYSLNYDSNGGTGTMEGHHNVNQNTEITLKENQFNKDGYTFTGWNTVASPTASNPGTTYLANSHLVVNKDTILYAQWEENKTVNHSVYIEDLTNETPSLELKAQTSLSTNELAYTNEVLTDMMNQYLDEHNYQTGYLTLPARIEVKVNDEWIPYVEGSELSNGSEVRYILSVSKDLTQTKTLNYTVEYWLEGEQTARESKVISKEVWVGEIDNTLAVENIVLNNYEGYKFSHFEPSTLPAVVTSGTVIKVVYDKVKIPVIPPIGPEVPTPPVRPETPVTPPVDPVVPTPPVGPTTPVVPEQPTTPVIPTTPVTPIVITPNNTPVVETPTTNQTPVAEDTTNIEDTVVPLANDVEDISDNEVPLAANVFQGHWALINLICTIAVALIAIIGLLFKHKKEEDNKENDSEEYEETEVFFRRRWTKVTMILLAVVSIIIFLLTENITLPMQLMDKWTWLMAVLLIIQVVLVIFARNWKKEDPKQAEPQLEQ